ncbi:uncharacterized protein LOC106062685 isoform X1 [Biomphalaria glabrata]|uniref:Uncharacterized protein LOC106062685 isoform X1 n=1 Tax=Biomphalaria glabrata TaxID=6526 RepID=A0A9W2YEA8_BIOGL|nr:uncharacterized protein LOC106062685 isoform X1 [Biomphalaria glabrata]XP_055861027.1 uncharacterized protein LOC106062685 isoform X1 [Biomphalaria glabrata]XP_055861072.1 uncharacterized protein LOC106062685 isoform X1 [Biomphalaria glabrata]XP_055861133.1 uncharacterized protein LOC106062685 isoform X1 [Biomphalaria glabrata]XP_055861204.1 uncharacterized protein LOC106062685 isoform X1 [Biomphalaria glabrata]
MFSTHSAIPQLKPDTILKCIQVTEDHQWSLGDLAAGQDGAHDTQELGSLLLNQSICLRKLHGFFSQLESRKCCLHLTCRRSTLNSMRVVPASTTEEDGGLQRRQSPSGVSYLDNKNLRSFKNAYMCAVYPVLAAPEPPITPSPAFMETSAKGHLDTASLSNSLHYSDSSYLLLSGRHTSYSSHDSGWEEAEEAAIIPMETVCEQLQRAFGLSKTLFLQYESLLMKCYAKKTPQRILAEEFAGQLILLETNSHPYYTPSHFLSQSGYDLWQKQERSHISELLNKFWQYSLPFPVDNQELRANLSVVHDDYEVLLRKLLEYESQFRIDHQIIASDVFVPLSSASSRLLLEFALRYGIGELYRKVILLHCLTSDFTPSIGYLTYINNLMTSILQMLPANKSLLIMVKKEFNLLNSCLQILKVQSCKALSQMKLLFLESNPAHGLDCLLSVLQIVLLLKHQLAPPNAPQETLTECVTATVQSMFQRSYDMFKVVALKELNKSRTSDMDPRLVNAVMEDIQEDVAGFKNKFEACFVQFFSISQMAARSFYHLLMLDVRELTQHRHQHQTLTQIDLQMLGLVYRLNKLDMLWRQYIPPQMQVWRGYFLPYFFQWQDALSEYLQDVVLDAVANDTYRCQNLQLAHPLFTYQQSVSSSDRKSCTFSLISFSPSVNSAFSCFTSPSNTSTPQQNCICSIEESLTPLCNSPEQTCDQKHQTLSEADGMLNAIDTQHKGNFDTISLNLETSHPKELIKFSITSHKSLPDNLHLLNRPDKAGEQSQDNKLDPSLFHTLDALDHLDFRRSTNEHQSYRPDLNSTTFFLPSINLDISDDDLLQGQGDSELDQSDNEDFKFPPLKMVTSGVKKDIFNSDLLRPVFSKSMSQDSLAEQKEAPINNTQEQKMTQDLIDSSEMRNILHAVMPISGSTIDIVVIFQRLCSFSGVLAATYTGEVKPVQSSQILVQPASDQTEATTDIPMYVDFKNVQSTTDDNFPTQELIETITIEQSILKLKFVMYLRVLKSVCHLLTVYATNLLCMDLCATPRCIAKKLIGLKLMDMIDKFYTSGMIRTCRHQTETANDCLFYYGHQGQWNERHEPLTQQMCTRINNVSACLDILEEYQAKLLASMTLDNIQIPPAPGGVNWDKFFGSSIPQEFWPMWADEEDTRKDILTESVSKVHVCWVQECKEILELQRQHLMLVLTAQCRLMAYKTNLFIKDGLEFNLRHWSDSMTISSCLSPVTTFLQKYLDSFSTWLYHDCFHRVLENIWIFIVQDFESHASQLVKTGHSSGPQAHTWMLAIMHLMKFIHNNGKGINRDLLLSQANHVLFQLELYTLSTLHLLALFQSLMDFRSIEGDRLTMEENATRQPPAITHRIMKELQSLRKSFSGAELIHWIIKNQNVLPADMPIPSEPLTKKTAQIICQNLLDQNFIVELSTEALTRRTTPVSFGQTAEFTSYPELSIHSSVAQYNDYLLEEARYRSFTVASLTTGQNFSLKYIEGHRSRTATLESLNAVESSFAERTKVVSDQARANSALRGSPEPVTGIESQQLPVQYSNLTPFSSLTDVRAEDHKNTFIPSSSVFYLVRQSVFLPTQGSLNQGPCQTQATLSETEHRINKLKESSENLSLVEKCLAHKISPLVILSIIASRKKVDRLAREYLKQASPSTLNKLRTILDEPSLECTS